MYLKSSTENVFIFFPPNDSSESGGRVVEVWRQDRRLRAACLRDMVASFDWGRQRGGTRIVPAASVGEYKHNLPKGPAKHMHIHVVNSTKWRREYNIIVLMKGSN